MEMRKYFEIDPKIHVTEDQIAKWRNEVEKLPLENTHLYKNIELDTTYTVPNDPNRLKDMRESGELIFNPVADPKAFLMLFNRYSDKEIATMLNEVAYNTNKTFSQFAKFGGLIKVNRKVQIMYIY